MSSKRLGNGLGDPNGLSLPYTTLPYIRKAEFIVSKEERAVLRELAKRVKELSMREIESDKKELWYAHNSLKQKRPMVFIDVENGWYEVIPHTSLKCKGELARIWEFRLRKEIYRGEVVCDDYVITGEFPIQFVYEMSDFGIEHIMLETDNLDGAYHWIADISDYSKDFKKLHTRNIKVDDTRSEELFNLAQETLGDILNVVYEGCFWWSLGMTWDLISLRGMEEMMIDMYENERELHALMALLRDDALERLDFLEANNYLTLNNGGHYVGSGGYGWSRELPSTNYDGKHVRTMDMWGFCESQETLGISPAMFEEFIFAYQKPILERFGLNCYGCCEPLDKRWHVVKNIPRLRRVSVSAWADREAMANNLKKDYIYSWKPNPAMLATTEIDESDLARYVADTLKIAKDCNVEIIMKDNHTLANDASRVAKWVSMVKNEIEKI